MRPFLEGGHLAVAHLVQDPAGILVAEVVNPGALAFCECLQRRRGEFGSEREGLQASEDAVPAEDRHEPGQPSGRQRLVRHGQCREPQCRQVRQAASVDALQRLPVALKLRRVPEPLLQAAGHVAAHSLVPLAAYHDRAVLWLVGRALRDYDVQLGAPLAMRRHGNAERKPVLVDGSPCGRGDPGLPGIGIPLVLQHQAAVDDASVVAALLSERIFHLEQVSEVARGFDAHGELDRLAVVVQDPQLLAEPVGYLSLADHRELRVDVDRPGARHKEEPGLEILQVVR